MYYAAIQALYKFTTKESGVGGGVGSKIRINPLLHNGPRREMR